MIEVQVWDADEVSNDDLVGEGSLALQPYLVDVPRPPEWINLSYKVSYLLPLGKKCWSNLCGI